MTIYDAIILGGIQGLTEFFPISSSGHLVLAQYWLGLKESMLTFDIAVHWGTLLAIGIYFWKDIGQLLRDACLFLPKRLVGRVEEEFYDRHPGALTAGFIFVSTLPTVGMAILLYELFEISFQSVLTVGLAWIAMGVFLIASRTLPNGNRPLRRMSHLDAFAIGIAQGMALIPGISRSGSTILMALYCGLGRREAARYSFLLAFPAIIGAGILKWREALVFWQETPSLFLGGVGAAAVIGYSALFLLMRFVERGKLHFFGYYCLLIGLFSVLSNFL